jgi:hypothetical protein
MVGATLSEREALAAIVETKTMLDSDDALRNATVRSCRRVAGWNATRERGGLVSWSAGINSRYDTKVL